MSLNIVTVIQSRMDSTRLPGKVMMPLAGKPLLYRMYERVAASELIGKIIIAATEEEKDIPIIQLCKENKIDYYRGHSTDLLDRHYQAAKFFDADVVVKIPSDCPLIDPNIIDKVIKYYIDNHHNYDFVSNLHPPSYPDGNDVEIMTMQTLEDAWKNAKLPLEREHTTPYFWENPEKFRIGNIVWETGLDFSMTHRFTIDYQEDYDFIKTVYDELYSESKIFVLDDIINLLTGTPDIRKLNKKYAGVNWYRNHLNELKTIDPRQTKVI
jgi:spore coat polysaccharide biosynthesis protein SpsF